MASGTTETILTMKVLVTFSGGKDSLAALLWTREHITKNFTTVFCARDGNTR